MFVFKIQPLSDYLGVSLRSFLNEQGSVYYLSPPGDEMIFFWADADLPRRIHGFGTVENLGYLCTGEQGDPGAIEERSRHC